MKHTDLRRKRSQLGISQIKLAEQMDVSERSLIRWENGYQEIPKIVELALEYLLMIRKEGKQ